MKSTMAYTEQTPYFRNKFDRKIIAAVCIIISLFMSAEKGGSWAYQGAIFAEFMQDIQRLEIPSLG